MQNMNACKIATAILVFSLFLSTLVIIPGATVQGADSNDKKLSFNVIDTETGDFIENAQAVIKEVHTGKTITTYTDAVSGLATFSPWSGYYQLTITKSGYYAFEYPDVIRFDGQSNIYLDILEMEPIPSSDLWFDLSVLKSGTSDPVQGVTLKVIDTAKDHVLYEGTANGAFNLSVYAAEYKLIVTSSGYAKNVTTVDVSDNTSLTMMMDPSLRVQGVVSLGGSPVASGLTAYMISKNTALDIDMRIIEPRTLGTNTFVFDAYLGEFYLVVKATGAMADVIDVTVSAPKTMSVNLNTPTTQPDTFEFDFHADDWNYFNLTRSFTYNFDMAHPALPFSFLPNLRMQIDFALGDGDGVVNATEAQTYKEKLEQFGPLNVTTEWLLKINGASFIAAVPGFESVSMTGVEGDVNSTTQFSVVTETHYSSIGSIDVGAPDYTGEVYARLDSDAIDNKYILYLPSGYELVGNTTAAGKAQVSGYTAVTIDPAAGTGAEKVNLEFEESMEPTAVAGVVTDDEAYAVLEDATIDYYILKNDTAITFTAAGSYDPNGNPLTYTWDFGDGTVKTVSTETTTHTYTQTAFNLTVTLTVTDVAGLQDEDSFFVKVDGIEPVPVIYVDGEEVPAGGEHFTDQNKAVVFNGAHSFDYINSTDEVSPAGIIKSWQWDFGDGNKTTVLLGEIQNVTHTYIDAGTYSITLNATDAVGHNHTIGITVIVNDTTPPTISFKVLNSQFKDVTQVSPIENETLNFDATATRDNVDDFSNLTFLWEFGDDTNITGVGNEFANVTHTYTSIGVFTVKLTVTDTSDNSANKTQQVTVVSSPRPDLRIVSINSDPDRFTEGDTGRILVNVTNVGNDNATGIKASFYMVRADGSKSLIGESTTLTVDGAPTNLLEIDKSGIITFNWKPSTKGNYTIFVEVTADREINKADNTGTTNIVVDEAAWKVAAIYGGIFAVIVVIIVLFYFRKRLPMLGGKGSGRPRRGKK